MDQSIYPTDPNIKHQHGEGEDEHHHEKNSVLKKVKAKAKKIKDTIKKHGPGHNHDHGHTHEYPEGHIPDDHDLDEEDDDDEEEEELVRDPEIHGAPMYESAAAKTAVSGQPDDLSRPGITHERLKGLPTDPLASRERSENIYTGNHETKHYDPPHKTGLGGQEPRVNLRNTFEGPPAPQNTPLPPSFQAKDANPTKTLVHVEEEYTEQPKVNLQTPKGLEEDLAALKDTSNSYIPTNYETKVTDPTGEGGEATGMSPILHSLDKMKINDDQDRGRTEENLPPVTGTHGQFSPEPAPPLSTEPTPQEHSPNQSSYTEKISSATSAIADKAVSAKNTVASKLGYGEKDETSPTTNESREVQGTTNQASAMDYGKKMAATVTDKLSPVYEKVAGAGSAVMSKLPGTGTATEVETTEVQGQDKGVSMKSYIAEKLKPGEEDKALSEVISGALQKPKEDLGNETRPRGKVTESEEVASRLGSFDETNERLGSGSVNSPTKSVVDTIRGTVGSWFGKSEGSQGTQQAHSPSSGNTGVSDPPSDRQLQESGN